MRSKKNFFLIKNLHLEKNTIPQGIIYLVFVQMKYSTYQSENLYMGKTVLHHDFQWDVVFFLGV